MADRLEQQLAAAGNLPAQERKAWEEDITAWRAAEQAGADQPIPPDVDHPYRWYDYLTRQDRQEITQEYAAY